MKKVISSILVVCYILALVPAIIVAVTTEQGTTGDCTWTLTGTVLTISGNGEVESGVEPKPWSDKMDKITKVKIKKGITSIGSFAFSDYKSLSSVTIPDSVTSIGAYAFDGTSYFNNKDNWKDGMLYIDECLIQAKDTIEGTCAIKPGTNVIAEEAFYDCKNLSEIILPSSVTSIGDSAFQGCMNLSRIKIPDSITSIGDNAFRLCDNLSEIIIPDSIKNIGADAFNPTAYANDAVNWDGNMLYLGNYLIGIKYNESDIYNIRNGTKVIADDVFSNCKNPSSITIPSSVIHIGEGNDVITSHAYNIDNYSHFIPLIALVGLGVGAAVFLIIRKSVKKHKSDESR